MATLSPKAEAFIESRQKLAKLVTEGHAWCCEHHMKAFFDIQETAGSDAAMSEAQLAYARSIWMGRVSHSSGTRQDPQRIVTTTCVEADCDEDVTGPAAVVGGEWKNRCETHRA